MRVKPNVQKMLLKHSRMETWHRQQNLAKKVTFAFLLKLNHAIQIFFDFDFSNVKFVFS